MLTHNPFISFSPAAARVTLTWRRGDPPIARLRLSPLVVYDFLLHHSGQASEELVDGLSALSADLHMGNSIVLGQFLAFLPGDLSLFPQVAFVADDHDLRAVADCFREVLDPVACVGRGVRTE